MFKTCLSFVISDNPPGGFTDESYTIVDKEDKKPISSLRQFRKTVFRLSDFMGRDYKTFARYKIEKMKVVFMDKLGRFLPLHTHWLSEDNATTVRISYPNLFKVRNKQRQDLTFYTNQQYSCKSSYVKDSK